MKTQRQPASSAHMLGVLLASLAVVSSAGAGPIYKCVDSTGASAYQEMPCPKASKLAGRGYAPTVAPAPQLGWAAQSSTLQQQQRTREAQYEAESPHRQQYYEPQRNSASEAERKALMSDLDSQLSSISSPNSRSGRRQQTELLALKSDLVSGEAERKAMMSQLDSQLGGINSPNSRGGRQQQTELLRMQTNLLTGGKSQIPVYSDPTPSPRRSVPPVSNQITDQYSNTYTLPPGSAFATDNATGKQCFVNGVFVHCN